MTTNPQESQTKMATTLKDLCESSGMLKRLYHMFTRRQEICTSVIFYVAVNPLTDPENGSTLLLIHIKALFKRGQTNNAFFIILILKFNFYLESKHF